jgi:FKBP-type peptidyl-prolyl cis-trans isomerase SlyD
LEGLLLGCLAGERLERVVPAALAYGPYHPERVVRASPGDFPAGTLLKVGEQFYSEDGTGQAVAYRIVSTNPDFITLDANHPWAGEDLHYRIHLLSVRPAEPEELEHGHVHGEGGVKH